LANSTVNSHITISQPNTLGSTTVMTVVKIAPISTRNITGFFHNVRGIQLAQGVRRRCPQHPRVEQATLHTVLSRAQTRRLLARGVKR
jgi:hypothetical protein